MTKYAGILPVPRVDVSTVLPVHMIKDPLTWMQSTITPAGHYSLRLVDRKTKKRKPFRLYPVNETSNEVEQAFYNGKDHATMQYASMPHAWNDWNRRHIDVSYPTLVVRYEDLLFDTERTVRALCDCIGGKPKNEIFLEVNADVKFNHAGHSKETTSDFKDAMFRKYSDKVKRFGAFTRDDINFIKGVVDPDLLAYFRYSLEKSNGDGHR